MIVDYALNYGHVVRLKGGDPFVFGRGQEEIEHVEAFDIPTEVIPGISSSVGVPGLQKIPVTRRNDSESFWVITGTTQTRELVARPCIGSPKHCNGYCSDGYSKARSDYGNLS